MVKPQTTLRQVLVHPKDKVDKQKKAGVVAKFRATISKSYTSVKQGDSWETQKAEKISEGNFTRSTCRASTNEHHKSAITDHVCQNNHSMNWEAREIVEQESDKLIRSIKESILCVRSNTPTMNRDEGACQLSPIWTQVISTPNQGRGRLQSDLARLSQ